MSLCLGLGGCGEDSMGGHLARPAKIRFDDVESPWSGCLTTAAVDAVCLGEQSPDHVMVSGFPSCGYC